MECEFDTESEKQIILIVSSLQLPKNSTGEKNHMYGMLNGEPRMALGTQLGLKYSTVSAWKHI